MREHNSLIFETKKRQQFRTMNQQNDKQYINYKQYIHKSHCHATSLEERQESKGLESNLKKNVMTDQSICSPQTFYFFTLFTLHFTGLQNLQFEHEEFYFGSTHNDIN